VWLRRGHPRPGWLTMVPAVPAASFPTAGCRPSMAPCVRGRRKQPLVSGDGNRAAGQLRGRRERVLGWSEPRGGLRKVSRPGRGVTQCGMVTVTWHRLGGRVVQVPWVTPRRLPDQVSSRTLVRKERRLEPRKSPRTRVSPG
jgi:hypothetical protein